MSDLTLTVAQYILDKLNIKTVTPRSIIVNKNKSAILINDGKVEIGHKGFNVNHSAKYITLSKEMEGFVEFYLGTSFLVKYQISKIVIEMIKENSSIECFSMNQLNFIGVQKCRYLVMEHYKMFYVVDIVSGKLGVASTFNPKVKLISTKLPKASLLNELRLNLHKLGLILPEIEGI